MDVTSLVIAVALVGQAPAGDRYSNPSPSYTPPGGASLSTPTPTPSYSPSPASPGYAPPTGAASGMTSPVPSYSPSAVPPDPLLTAAAAKKTPVGGPSSSSAPGNLPATTVAPISTPVPNSGASREMTPAATASPAAAAAPPPPTVPDSARALDLVREAVALPKSATIEGNGRTLIETLAPLGDRRRQLEAVTAYWRLATETAEYHFEWQHLQFLEHLQKSLSGNGGNTTTAAEVGSLLATSQARLRENELRLYDAQYELSQRSWTADGATRPLTVDLPHTGSYRTQFEKLFGGGVPSGRIVLLNRTLPMRQQIVNVRAESVWAAQNGYEQTFSAFQQGRLPPEEVLAALDDFRRRRSEFITAVRRYNDEIAEYAFMSAPEGISTATLVGMLLKNPTKPAANAVSDASWGTPFVDPGVTPATFNAPSVPTGTPTLAPPLSTPRPDPISAPATSPNVPPNFIPSPSAQRMQEPAQLAAPSTAYTAAGDPAPLAPGSVPPPITPEMQRRAAINPDGTVAGSALPVANAVAGNPLRGQPTLAPPPTSSTASPAAPYSSSVVPATAMNPYAASPPTPPTNPYGTPSGAVPPPSVPGVASPPGLLPPFVPQQTQPAPLPQTRYKVHTTNFQSTAPIGQARAQATQELVESLYNFPTSQAGTLSLDACLANADSHERTEILAVYWSAAEQRARQTVWEQVVATLQGVSSQNPRVQAAAFSAEAEAKEALVVLERVRLRLTELVGHSLEEAWLLPITLPHGGRYDMKAEALTKRIAADPRLQRDVERLPTLHETLVYRAEAVTAARSAAQSAVSRLASQPATTHLALAAVERQARETCELLKTTTRYNLTIADYALNVLPTTTPRDAVVSALVLGRNTVASRP